MTTDVTVISPTEVAVADAVVELDAAADAAVAEYARLGVEIKRLESLREAHRKTILAAMGGSSKGTFMGRLRVTVAQISRTVVDAKELLKAYPDAYAATTHETVYPRISPK